MAQMFDDTKYYRFTNDVFGVGVSMSLTNNTSQAHPGMTTVDTLMSEYWQIFYQQGAFFIRNYMFNASYQLGVGSDLEPVMVPSSGSFNQQWLIENWDGSLSKMKLVNALIFYDNLANNNLLGCDPLSPNVTIVSLQTEASWLIHQVPSAGNVTAEMLLPIQAIEAQPSGVVGTTTPSSTAEPTTTPGVVPGGPYLHPQPESSGGFNGLDKTGVAVGIIVIFTFLITGALLYRKWKKGTLRWHPRAAGPVPTGRSPSSRRRRNSETVAEPPPAYLSRPDTSQPSTSFGVIPSYYEASRSSRPKMADEESIELPAYGMSPVEPRSAI